MEPVSVHPHILESTQTYLKTIKYGFDEKVLNNIIDLDYSYSFMGDEEILHTMFYRHLMSVLSTFDI